MSALPPIVLHLLVAQLPRLPWPSHVVWAALGLMAVVVVLATVRRVFRRAPAAAGDDLRLEKVDITSLSDAGPPPGPESLHFYHVPVRLALLVLAPVGRDGRLPESEDLPELVDQLLPGLTGILSLHQPQFRRWPPQLSSEGFTQAFFSHVNLPGDHGKGTPWCSIAGKFETAEGQYLAGMVCRAATRNSLGQVAIDHAGKWLDVLRVHG